jgi:flagellar FliL protein
MRMAKADKEPVDDEEPKDGEDGAAGDAASQGFVKRLLSNKKMLIIAGAGALVLILGLGAGSYFLFFSGSDDEEKTAAAQPYVPPTPPQVAFYDVPDILVNIQTPDGTAAYLKISVALELDSDLEKPGLQVLMPRLVDQFQSYLRELRIDDLKGSAGVVRLKEELLRRVNASAAPYHVRDVLLKEMIVQ